MNERGCSINSIERGVKKKNNHQMLKRLRGGGGAGIIQPGNFGQGCLYTIVIFCQGMCITPLLSF